MTSKLDVVQAWNNTSAGDAQATGSFLSEDFENIMADGTVQS